MTPAGACCVCDALEGGCGHDGPRYLEPIVYVKAGGGFVVPPSERSRWENPPRVSKAELPAVEPTPLPKIVAELEVWLDLDADLERRLRAAYASEPLKVSRIAEALVVKCRAGQLRSPAGLLAVRLRALPAVPAG